MEVLKEIGSTMAGRVLLSGAVVNFILIIIGSFVGLLFKKGIPIKVQDTLMNGMALCVLYIGVTGLFEKKANIIVIIISVALGGIIGELLNLDKQINNLGDKIERTVSKNNSSTKVAEGFVTATLLFCIGAMSVVGSIDSGIKGDNSTLYSKSLIDAISAMVFSSGLGIGVMLSAVPVLMLEGGITLLAFLIAPILSTYIISQISIIGSLLIIAISFNMLKITKIKVMNFIPAVFLPLLLCIIIK